MAGAKATSVQNNSAGRSMNREGRTAETPRRSLACRDAPSQAGALQPARPCSQAPNAAAQTQPAFSPRRTDAKHETRVTTCHCSWSGRRHRPRTARGSRERVTPCKGPSAPGCSLPWQGTYLWCCPCSMKCSSSSTILPTNSSSLGERKTPSMQRSARVAADGRPAEGTEPPGEWAASSPAPVGA